MSGLAPSGCHLETPLQWILSCPEMRRANTDVVMQDRGMAYLQFQYDDENITPQKKKELEKKIAEEKSHLADLEDKRDTAEKNRHKASKDAKDAANDLKK